MRPAAGAAAEVAQAVRPSSAGGNVAAVSRRELARMLPAGGGCRASRALLGSLPHGQTLPWGRLPAGVAAPASRMARLLRVSSSPEVSTRKVPLQCRVPPPPIVSSRPSSRKGAVEERTMTPSVSKRATICGNLREEWSPRDGDAGGGGGYPRAGPTPSGRSVGSSHSRGASPSSPPRRGTSAIAMSPVHTSRSVATHGSSQAVGATSSEPSSPTRGRHLDEDLRSEIWAIFARLAHDGEVACDELPHAIRLLGHPYPDEEIMAQIDMKQRLGRSFVDRSDYMQFCEAYHFRWLDKVRALFSDVDRFFTGSLGLSGVCTMLAQDGIRPLPTILNEFLTTFLDVQGGQLKVSFADYLRVDRVVQLASGVFDSSHRSIRKAFPRAGGRRRGVPAASDLDVALKELGFVPRPAGIELHWRSATHSATDLEAVERDFLAFVRRHRDAEVDALIAALVGCGWPVGSEAPAREVSAVLGELGYLLASPEAVGEAAAAAVPRRAAAGQPVPCGGAAEVLVDFDFLFLVFERLREAWGFLAAELSDLQGAYRRYRKAVDSFPASSELAGEGDGGEAPRRHNFLVELTNACRAIGFPAQVWVVQSVLDDEHLDSYGLVDVTGFKRILAELRRREIQAIRVVVEEVRRVRAAALAARACSRATKACLRPGRPQATPPESPIAARLNVDGHSNRAPPPPPPLRRLACAAMRCEEGEAEGAPRAADRCEAATVSAGCLRGVMTRLGYPPDGADTAPSDRRVGIWEADAILRQRRRLRATAAAASQGFSEEEVRNFRVDFCFAQLDSNGALTPKAVASALAAHFPLSTSNLEEHRRAKRLLDQAVAGSKDGTMHFPEYILLMRLISHDRERARLDEELKAVETAGFSRTEVRDFRELFRGGLSTAGSDSMTLADFVSMVARIMPVISVSMEDELREMLQELEPASKDAFSFGTFLRVMQQLSRENWHGINEAAEDIRAKVAEEPTPPEPVPEDVSTTASTSPRSPRE